MLMASAKKPVAAPPQKTSGQLFFAIAAGLFFLVAIVKFGDPVVLDDLVQAPQGGQAALFESWPVKWGYWLLWPLIAVGLAVVDWKKPKFKWQLALPLVWLLWQFVSATHTVNPDLTRFTLEHF